MVRYLALLVWAQTVTLVIVLVLALFFLLGFLFYVANFKQRPWSSSWRRSWRKSPRVRTRWELFWQIVRDCVWAPRATSIRTCPASEWPFPSRWPNLSQITRFRPRFACTAATNAV